MSASNISESRIRALPPLLVDRIAAGEVVDGPYSVTKELVENALDSGATSVAVETTAGGMDRIIIVDNGCGIRFEELPLSLERHATSKIESLEDIAGIVSFGFRGEALASIGSVSHLEIRSTHREAPTGGRIESRGGHILVHEPAPPVAGTTVTISELFYSVPARRKFIRSERIENARIYRELLKAVFAREDVAFSYVRDGREMLNTRSGQDLRARIGQIFRSKIADRLIAVSGAAGAFRIHGLVGDEHCYRTNREGIFTYVNGRAVELPNAAFLIRKAFGELLPGGSFPYAFLFVDVDPREVDVNVHPAKKEIRFRDASTLNSLLLHSVFEALRPGEPVRFEQYRKRGGEQAMDREPLSGHDAFADRGAPLGQGPVGAGQESQRLMGAPAPYAAGVFEMPGTGEALGAMGSGEPSRESQDALRSSFVPLRHFGVIFGTYILAEGEDSFYIIDQHTAHERVNYERMRSRLEDLQSQRQGLLHPVVVECLPDEFEAVRAELPHLIECGFLVEEFGPNTYIVREVPGYVDPGTEQDSLQHVIQRLSDGESVVRVYDELAAMKACKASIKRNDHVSGETISQILLQLAQCENPSRCPHGRPTMMKLSRSELDRMFHRS